MAVTIPRLNPIQTAAPGSAGRLEVSAPNLLGATAPLREGLTAGLGDVADAYKEVRKKELETKSLKATEYATKYEQAAKLSLDKKSLLKGDPTQAYKEFDEELVNLEKSVYEQVGEDPETQYFLREKIIKANGRISDTRNTNQTKQYYGWQKEVADSSVKLRQDNVAKNSQYLDVRNQMTFGSVQSQIDEIEGTRIAIAIQNGYDIKQVDEERTDPITGQKYRYKGWDYSNAPAVESQIKADIGDAIIPTVKSLNAAGKIAEAKQLIKDQGRWLNATDLAKLTSDNDEASVKNRALDQLSKQPSWSIDQINALTGVGEDVKLKMREINHTNSLHAERERKQKTDAVMNAMYQDIQAVKNTNTPYVSAEDFKNRSKLWQNNKDMLSVENMKTIDKLVTTVDETDPKAFNEAMSLVQSGELTTIGGEKLLNLRSKIEDKVWNKVFDTYFKNNVPDSESRKQANIAFASKEITNYFTKQVDQFGNPTFPKNKKGQYTNAADEQLVAQAQQQLADWIGSSPSASTKEIQDKAKEFYNDAIKAKEEATPGWIKNVRSFMDSFRSQNPLMGGKRPSLSKETPDTTATVKVTPDQVQNNPSAATQQTTPAATQNGGNMAKWSSAQWFQAYDADPANKNKSFSNPQEKQKAVRDYARKKLGK